MRLNLIKISFFPQPWWLTVTQVPCILTISPPFPQQCKPSYSAGSWSKRIKIYLKLSFALINGYFFPFFLFILLRFKSHQTLYVSASLAHSLILCYHIQYVYEICLALFYVSSTLRDDSMQHYIER